MMPVVPVHRVVAVLQGTVVLRRLPDLLLLLRVLPTHRVHPALVLDLLILRVLRPAAPALMRVVIPAIPTLMPVATATAEAMAEAVIPDLLANSVDLF